LHSAGFTEDQMQRWHQQFEQQAPEEHQEFLEYLQIPGEEIDRIRAWSQKS